MLKSIIKRVPLAVRVNAAWKSAQTKARYREWCNRYGSPCIMDAADRANWVRHFMPDWAPGRPESDRFPGRRFFFVSASWDQDRSGLIQGLQTLGKVGIFHGPDAKNELRMPRDSCDIEACREANGVALEAEFGAFAREGIVSALIGQMWNFSVPAAVLARIRGTGVPIINIAMDDRHSFHRAPLSDGSDGGVAGIVREITLGATAAPECVSWYRCLGTRAVFFPEASDPALFKPSNLPKIHDITFVGANYGFRTRVVARLRRAGLHVTTYGSGWPEGRIDSEVIPELFARSRIVLGIGAILHCDDFHALKLRDFDGPMSGSLYLTQDNPDLSLIFQIGEEIDTWHDVPELISKCRQYLADEATRERIAGNGRIRVTTGHTWNHRFRSLLAHLDNRCGCGI